MYVYGIFAGGVCMSLCMYVCMYVRIEQNGEGKNDKQQFFSRGCVGVRSPRHLTVGVRSRRKKNKYDIRSRCGKAKIFFVPHHVRGPRAECRLFRQVARCLTYTCPHMVTLLELRGWTEWKGGSRRCHVSVYVHRPWENLVIASESTRGCRT